jgi:predicted Zn-dependent protease
LKSSITVFLVANLVLALLGACQPMHNIESNAVGVDRSQRVNRQVTELDLRAGAATWYSEALDSHRREANLSNDVAATTRLRSIARRLIAVSGRLVPSAPAWAWEINLLESNTLQAYCLSGGKCLMHRALLGIARSDDEVAALLAHLFAHVLLEHGRERATDQAKMALPQLAARVTLGLPHSRLQEQEADRIATELAARAGFDPSAALVFWQKLARSGNGNSAPLIDLHPSSESRTQDLSNYGQRVMPLFEAARLR